MYNRREKTNDKCLLYKRKLRSRKVMGPSADGLDSGKDYSSFPDASARL